MKKITTLSAIPGIYKITIEATGQFYIGSSGVLSHREFKHMYSLRKGNHYVKELQEAFSNNEKITFEVLSIASDKEEAFKLEQEAISSNLGSNLFLNKSIDAVSPGKGRIWSEEQKKKISIANKGRNHGTDAKEKISKANRGRVFEGEKLLSLQKRNIKEKGKPVTYNGVTFPSISQAAKENNIARLTLLRRLSK